MKITGYGTIGSTTGPTKRSGVSPTSSFADVLAATEAENAAPASSLTDVAATAALNNLLALQEISEEDVKRKKLAQQGKNMLDSLEKLRMQLLAGTVPAHTMQELSRQLSLQKQEVIDPQLRAIIDDIELRTAVELAKLEAAKPKE
jgi:hypothetical protein